MPDTMIGGLWLTIIDMSVVFLVLWVLALIIKAIKVFVAPFEKGSGPNGNGGGRKAPADEMEVVAAAEGESVEAVGAEVSSEVSAEVTAVISAAVAAYLEKPASGLVIGMQGTRREESLWAMAGRTRIMQSRELVRRRATA
ncbi:MAG: OadG family protein [Firmicutes bacterium]|nr:OadG family protein [Bacillota bacterium]